MNIQCLKGHNSRQENTCQNGLFLSRNPKKVVSSDMNIEERKAKRKDTKISYIYQYAQCSLKQLKQYDKKIQNPIAMV